MKVEESKDFKRLREWLLRPTPESAVRRVFSTSAAVATDIGIGRGENQDRAAIVRMRDFEGNMYLLATVSDGMGGMQGGAICAATTLAAFICSFLKNSRAEGKCDDWLIDAAFDANRVVNDLYLGKGGATLSVLLIGARGKSFWLNVGDSRIYADLNGELHQITVDDTIAGQFGDQISSLKNRSDLLQFIGMGRELDPHCSGFYLDGYISFLLTTDGVHYLDKAVLNSIQYNAPDPGVCIRRLIDVAKWSGSKDNCSALMIFIDGLDYCDVATRDKDLFEVWDSFGELHFYSELGSVNNDFSPPRFSGEELLTGGGKTKVKVKNKTTLVGKRVGGAKKTKPSIEQLALARIQDTNEENKSEDSSDKTTHQLKISFPRKE